MKKILLAFAVAFTAPAASAQQDFDWTSVEIKSTHVAGSVHMIEGRGGNIGISAGPDGVFMIDDQFAPLTDRLIAKIREISDGEIRFLVNTHVHGDHTGGNENLGRAGVMIFAQDNVRKRMAEGIRGGPPAPEDALPLVTYSDTATFHLNGEDVTAFRVPPAHTDGDTFIHFKGANVLHLGDVFRTTSYPVIDTGNGGTFAGVIAATEIAIEIAGPETKIIPGHGFLTDKSMLITVRDMLVDIRDRVQVLIDDGKSLEEVIAARPTAVYDERWDQGGMGIERFLGVIYAELKGE